MDRRTDDTRTKSKSKAVRSSSWSHHNFNRTIESNTIDLQQENLPFLPSPPAHIISKMMRSLILLVSAAMAMAASPAFFGRGTTSASIARSSVFGVSRGGGLFGGKTKDG